MTPINDKDVAKIVLAAFDPERAPKFEDAKIRLDPNAANDLAERMPWTKGMIPATGYQPHLPRWGHPDPLICLNADTGHVSIGFYAGDWRDAHRNGIPLEPQPTHWAFIPGIRY